MNQIETYLQQRAVIQNEVDAKKILEKQQLNGKIDADLQTIKKNLDQLSTVYESQKKNKKKVNLSFLFSTLMLKQKGTFLTDSEKVMTC